AINTLVLATVDSITKFKNKLAYYLAIFAMVFGSTFGSINSAMAAEVDLTNTGGDGSDGTFIGTDIDQAADTLINSEAASVTFDTAADAIAFNTLVTGANLALTITIDDSDDNATEVTDMQGDATVSTGSTLAITVTDGLFDIGADINHVGTGTSTITVAALQEVTTTGATKTIDSNFVASAATSIMDIDGTATFSGTVGAGVLDIDGVSTFNGFVAASGAATIDANVTFAGDATFSSTTETVLAGAGTAVTVTFTGETLTATGTNGIETQAANTKLLFDGTAAQTIASQITPDATNETIVENSNTAATVTFNEKIGVVGGALAKLVDTDTSTTSVFKKEVGAVLFTVDGTATLTLDSNQATNVDINTAGTLVIDDTITNGQEIFLAGTSVVDGSVAGTGNIQMPANLLDGETLVLIAETTDDADAAIVVDVEAAVLDTALRTYTVSAVAIGTDDNNITITAADNSATTVASNLGTTTNMGTALVQAGIAVEGDATALDAFSNALNANGYSATEDTALAKQAAPQDDMISGSTFATKAMTGSLQGIMSNRMASLRSGDAFVTGMSAGNGMSVNSGFIQAFGTEAEQKNKTVGSGTQFGYDASSAGLALGFDGITDNGSVVGLSFSMSNTDVDGKGTGNSKNDIDSYTVSVYADKTTDAGYIEGSLTVGLNENNSSRIVNTAGLDRTYKGDYDSEQVSLKIGGGMPNAVGTGFVTPFGSVTATRITTDAYTETSTTASDALRLKVAQDDVDSIVGTVGLKYHTILDNGGTPMISLAVNNEFGDNTINSTNTYQGGGTAFNTSTDVEELSATLGLGYSFRSDNTTFELAYEADAND
ncbi:autotransporter domain-containing protein, partial [Candidatus Pelagibacter ubique]|nr:autotransporter domain-containing protein [Candidatus Pelagibacter ubique]